MSPIIIIPLFALQFILLYILNFSNKKNEGDILFFVIFTLTEACIINMFYCYFPEVAYFSLILTIFILSILLIASHLTNIEEHGLSLVVSCLIFLLIFIILLGINNQQFKQIIFGSMLSIPFCFYIFYKVSQNYKKEIDLGFLMFSLKLYLYLLTSIMNNICSCCRDC